MTEPENPDPAVMDVIERQRTSAPTHDGMSTSARLRHVQAELADTQAALAASQRDLTAMETKRDQATENGDWWMRECRLAQAELASARVELEQLRSRPALPATTDEVRAWYAERGLAWSCGPGVLFAELRRYLNQGDPQ